MAKPKKSEAPKTEEKPILESGPEVSKPAAAPESKAVHPKFHKFQRGNK